MYVRACVRVCVSECVYVCVCVCDLYFLSVRERPGDLPTLTRSGEPITNQRSVHSREAVASTSVTFLCHAEWLKMNERSPMTIATDAQRDAHAETLERVIEALREFSGCE